MTLTLLHLCVLVARLSALSVCRYSRVALIVRPGARCLPRSVSAISHVVRTGAARSAGAVVITPCPTSTANDDMADISSNASSRMVVRTTSALQRQGSLAAVAEVWRLHMCESCSTHAMRRFRLVFVGYGSVFGLRVGCQRCGGDASRHADVQTSSTVHRPTRSLASVLDRVALVLTLCLLCSHGRLVVVVGQLAPVPVHGTCQAAADRGPRAASVHGSCVFDVRQ